MHSKDVAQHYQRNRPDYTGAQHSFGCWASRTRVTCRWAEGNARELGDETAHWTLPRRGWKLIKHCYLCVVIQLTYCPTPDTESCDANVCKRKQLLITHKPQNSQVRVNVTALRITALGVSTDALQYMSTPDEITRFASTRFYGVTGMRSK